MLSTIQDGALALLGETTKILNANQVEYIIVGGWSPFLLNSSPLPHPGTKDVDILFKSGTKRGELNELIRIFLDKGFIQSAKHPFQLLKPFTIEGFDFMYNIDLLHPDDQSKDPQMFVDHIDFPVKESLSIRIDYSGKTILLPKSDFFFNGFVTKETYNFEFPDGTIEAIEFNLLNEAGLILSKTKSVFSAKRTRDAYDIFLAIHQSRDYNSMIKLLKTISETHSLIFNALQDIYSKKNMKKIYTNIYEWGSILDLSEDDRDAEGTFARFFNDLEIELKEE